MFINPKLDVPAYHLYHFHHCCRCHLPVESQCWMSAIFAWNKIFCFCTSQASQNTIYICSKGSMSISWANDAADKSMFSLPLPLPRVEPSGQTRISDHRSKLITPETPFCRKGNLAGEGGCGHFIWRKSSCLRGPVILRYHLNSIC